MGSESIEGGICHSLQIGSSSFKQTGCDDFLQQRVGEVCSTARGGFGSSVEGRDRTSSTCGCRILQPAVCGSQGFGRVAASLGCFQAEQICHSDKVQYGISELGSGGDSGVRLVDDLRHVGCVFSHSNSPNMSKVPKVCLRRRGVSVQSSLFRAVHRTTGIYKSIGASREVAEAETSQNFNVSGRLVGTGKVTIGSNASKGAGLNFNKDARYHDKCKKIKFNSKSTGSVFGHDFRLRKVLGNSDIEENRQFSQAGKEISKFRASLRKGMAKHFRSHEFLGKVCDRSKAKEQAVSVLVEPELGQGIGNADGKDSNISEEVVNLVEQYREVRSRGLFENGDAGLRDLLRCLKNRLGRHIGSTEGFGNLVSKRTKATYKRPGVESSEECSQELGKFIAREESSNLLGQHYRSSIHKEARGYSVLVPVQGSMGAASLGRREENSVGNSVCQGFFERDCRQAEQKRSSSSHRVVAGGVSLSTALDSVGHSGTGFICNQGEQTSGEVLFSGNRSSRLGNRCVSPMLEQDVPVCVPSIQSHQTGPKQTKGVNRSVNDSDNTMVATTRVASRFVQVFSRASQVVASVSGTVDSTRRGPHSSRTPHASSHRLETVKRFVRSKGFSRQAASRIAGCHRQSTTALYQCRWAKFVEWCRRSNISASRTTLSNIADFLIYLFSDLNLGIQSVKGYRATLASVLRHVGLEISESKDIQDLVRSFELERPISSKRIVNWNLDVVLKFLSKQPFEPLASANLRDLTCKTLFLISLASAGRVGEIQGLSKVVGFRLHEAIMSFVPQFRAKTDKHGRLPRSLVLKGLGSLVHKEEEDYLLCPVRALKYYLHKTEKLRGSSGNLFCSVKNAKRAMSKGAMAFFLKDTIRRAHEQLQEDMLITLKVKAHEIRGVATSFRFYKNLSVPDLINAAFWRCQSVFASHYLKDIEIMYQNCRALGPVIVAGTSVA